MQARRADKAVNRRLRFSVFRRPRRAEAERFEKSIDKYAIKCYNIAIIQQKEGRYSYAQMQKTSPAPLRGRAACRLDRSPRRRRNGRLAAHARADKPRSDGRNGQRPVQQRSAAVHLQRRFQRRRLRGRLSAHLRRVPALQVFHHLCAGRRHRLLQGRAGGQQPRRGLGGKQRGDPGGRLRSRVLLSGEPR